MSDATQYYQNICQNYQRGKKNWQSWHRKPNRIITSQGRKEVHRKRHQNTSRSEKKGREEQSEDGDSETGTKRRRRRGREEGDSESEVVMVRDVSGRVFVAVLAVPSFVCYLFLLDSSHLRYATVPEGNQINHTSYSFLLNIIHFHIRLTIFSVILFNVILALKS